MKNTFKLSRTNNQTGSLFTFLRCQNTKNFAFIALSLETISILLIDIISEEKITKQEIYV